MNTNKKRKLVFNNVPQRWASPSHAKKAEVSAHEAEEKRQKTICEIENILTELHKRNIATCDYTYGKDYAAVSVNTEEKIRNDLAATANDGKASDEIMNDILYYCSFRDTFSLTERVCIRHSLEHNEAFQVSAAGGLTLTPFVEDTFTKHFTKSELHENISPYLLQMLDINFVNDEMRKCRQQGFDTNAIAKQVQEKIEMAIEQQKEKKYHDGSQK
jgi:hypothetical protein